MEHIVYIVILPTVENVHFYSHGFRKYLYFIDRKFTIKKVSCFFVFAIVVKLVLITIYC